MVLQETDESRTRQIGGRTTLAPLAELRELAVVHIGVLDGLGQLADAPEVGVVAVPFACQHGMQGVVEIVVPARAQAIPMLWARSAQAGVVAVALGNEPQFTALLGRQPVDGGR